MLSWCKTRRAAVLFGVGGVLLVALLVHRIAPAAGDAVKKAAKPLSIPHPVKPEAAPAPAPTMPPPLPAYSPGPAGTAPLPPVSFMPPPAPPAVDFSNKTIDQLLNDLDVIRAHKGELEKQEKKVITVLGQKLADLEQRLRKYNLKPGDMPSCCTAPTAGEVRWGVPSVSH